MGTILAASPARVFIGRLGRIEVFQPIPSVGGRSPDGPHTHVLPKLLAQARTHAATEPIPEGWIPCAHFYPPHPMKDALGRPQPFDLERDQLFQKLLVRFGDPAYGALKKAVVDAVEAGRDPSTLFIPKNRFARASMRVALYQLKASSQR
jgi:hypothetical protein